MFRVAVLSLAISALTSGCGRSAPTDSRTPASATADSGRPLTFNQDIAPILFEHCASCHRPVDDGQQRARATTDSTADPICVAGAPFSVLDYAAVQRRARSIAAAVTSHAMPPWLPEHGHGDFVNERSLSDAQISLIARWVEQGAQEGEASRKPAPPSFAGGWQLGQPDLVLELPQPYSLHADQRDTFRNFVIPVPLPETRYVRAVEFRTETPRVLHHANVALDPSRVGRRLDRADREPGFAMMPDDEVQNVYGWSPGKVPVLESEDTAWALDPGTDLVVQLHMVSGGETAAVRPTIGLFFSRTPPTRTPIVVKLESKSLDIAAGDPNYAIEDSYVLPADVDALSVYPHAHYLATQMRGTATLPDGTERSLISIRRWDVRWQDQYRYRSPMFLPRGTKLAMRFTYDNSSANPNNPHRPPQRIKWGPLSTDEMGALWLEVVPRRGEDVAVLSGDYFRRALQADVAAAELQVRASPQDASAHNALALKYTQAGRAADAHRQLVEALRLKPDDAEAHSNLGTVLQSQGRLADGMTHLREAARLKPNDDRVHFNYGNGLLASGNVGDAVREYETALRLNPDEADAHFNLAMVLGPRNRLAEAVAHLRRVIEINPRNAEAHRNLALALSLQGRVNEAIPYARTAVRLEPDSTAARDQLQQLLASH
jgi:Flp pilus assembly protein TadD